MAPIPYAGSREAAMTQLITVIEGFPRTEILKRADNYLYATFTTGGFPHWVDDVEFYLPADQPLIHFRSASRVGYSDLGENRHRIARIGRRLVETQGVSS
jgi:uncharacterized protein (DUF1499 family)